MELFGLDFFVALRKIAKVDRRYTLFPGIFHSLPCAAVFTLDTEYNEIRPVNHFTVPFLMGSFEMTVSSSPADFYFIVILPEGFFVIPELCC